MPALRVFMVETHAKQAAILPAVQELPLRSPPRGGTGSRLEKDKQQVIRLSTAPTGTLLYHARRRLKASHRPHPRARRETRRIMI